MLAGFAYRLDCVLVFLERIVRLRQINKNNGFRLSVLNGPLQTVFGRNEIVQIQIRQALQRIKPRQIGFFIFEIDTLQSKQGAVAVTVPKHHRCQFQEIARLCPVFICPDYAAQHPQQDNHAEQG